MVKHIAAIYKEDYTGYGNPAVKEGSKIHTLHDILDEAVLRTKAGGSTTCVMAEIFSHDSVSYGEDVLVKTVNLGDSGYMILRPMRMSYVSDKVMVR